MSRISNAKTVDEYLAEQPKSVKKVLERVRQIIKTVAPEAQELISYRMPAYKYHGMLVGFGAFTNHCSLFLWKKNAVNKFKNELSGYSTAEGTIRFTIENPLPDDLVVKIVTARLQENLNKKK